MRQSTPHPRRRPDDPAPQQPPDDAVRRVLDATALLVGQRFLDELARHVGMALGVAHVVIYESADGDMRTVAAWHAPGVRPLDPEQQAPCLRRLRDSCSFWPAALDQQFPDLPWLREHGLVSCLCLSLSDESGGDIGAIAVLDVRPMETSLPAEALLRTLAPRIAGELERHRTERALRDSEARFRLLAEHAPDVIFRYNLATRTFDYISPAVERMTGYRPGEFARDPALALRIVHPDDRHAVERMLNSGDEVAGTCRWLRRDGRMIWVEYRNAPVRDQSGTTVAVEGIVRDVTEQVQLEKALREAEAHHRTLLEAFPDIIFRVSAEGIYLEAMAPEGLRMLLPAHAYPGKSLFDVLPVHVAEQTLRAIRHALATGEPQRVEFTLEVAGEVRDEEARVLPLTDGTAIVVVRLYSSGERTTTPAHPQFIKPPRGRPNPYNLTEREMAVLQRIAEGAADKQIAESLGISSYTVNKHVASILAKMHVSSRTAAGVRALREGLLA